MNSKLFVAGDASMNARLAVGGAAALKSTLNVIGATTLNDTLAVIGDVTASATLRVTDDASLNSKLFVNGDASLNSTLRLGGDASLNSKLFVAGDASLNSHVSARDVSAGIFQSGRLIFEDMTAGDNTPNTIRTTEGNINIRPHLASDWTIIASNLQVDGSINFTGSMIRTDTIVNVTQAFDVSNSGSREALSVEQFATNKDVAIFSYGNKAAPVFVVGHDNCVTINKDVTDINKHFDVSGNGRFTGTLEVGGVATFSDALNVTGDYSSTAGNITLTNGALTLSNGKLTTNTLEVSTTSEFKGDVTMRSHLKMDASKFIDQMGTEAW